MRRVTEVFHFSHDDRGFTLVEMIISIVIAGIVVGMVGLFGRRQIDAYLDIGNRVELSDAADTALRRIGRDLQSALPNSVRQDAGGNLIEYVPIRDAGRYRADVGAGGTGNILDFTSAADTTFDVLGPPVTITAGDQLVVYNTGQVGSDVYAGTSRRAAVPGSALTVATFAPAGVPFPLASPQNRFQIVGGPVTYECAANAVTPELGTVNRRWCYDFRAAQPTTFGALPVHAACASVQVSVLVNNVSACSFSFAPAILQRNGLVVLNLTLTRNGESVNLLHQVEVLNTP